MFVFLMSLSFETYGLAKSCWKGLPDPKFNQIKALEN